MAPPRMRAGRAQRGGESPTMYRGHKDKKCICFFGSVHARPHLYPCKYSVHIESTRRTPLPPLTPPQEICQMESTVRRMERLFPSLSLSLSNKHLQCSYLPNLSHASSKSSRSSTTPQSPFAFINLLLAGTPLPFAFCCCSSLRCRLVN